MILQSNVFLGVIILTGAILILWGLQFYEIVHLGIDVMPLKTLEMLDIQLTW